jgi:uncharacterized membrane protein YkgB
LIKRGAWGTSRTSSDLLDVIFIWIKLAVIYFKFAVVASLFAAAATTVMQSSTVIFLCTTAAIGIANNESLDPTVVG